MNKVFDLKKALKILKKQGISQGDVARTLGYDETYLSKMAGKMGPTDELKKRFLKEYGACFEGIELYFDDPIQEILASLARLELKVDAQSFLIAKIYNELNGTQKERLNEELNGISKDSEAFELINEVISKLKGNNNPKS